MSDNPELPRLVALCGKPQSGKSTAAELLVETYGYEIHDDGGPLRDIAMRYFGLSEEDVYTQEGKMRQIVVNGREMTVRQLLGELGEVFEEKFGANTVPLMSCNAQDPNKAYVMPSVRHSQGSFWKEMGAVVIEIDRPGTAESPYAFDRYSKQPIDHKVLNDPSEGENDEDLLRLLARLEEALKRGR